MTNLAFILSLTHIFKYAVTSSPVSPSPSPK
jgi:hypothetical protein